MATRKPYPSDVSDEEWAFVAPYLVLVREDAPQRNHDLLREVFNGLRWLEAGVFEEMVHDLRVLLLRLRKEGRTSEPTPAILDSRTLHSTLHPESGSRGAFE